MSEMQLATRQSAAAVIRSVEDLVKIGQFFEQSAMFGCTQQGQGVVLAMTCMQEGMTPLQFIERYHIVEGRPTMRSDAMLARLLELGGSYEILARDPERAAIKARFRNAEGTFTLSWTEAQNEPFTKTGKGTVKHNWATARGRMQMLWARVVSDAVRTVCPLANFGAYTPEEVQDFEERAPTAVQVETIPPAMAPREPAPEPIKPEVLPPAAGESSEVTDYSVMPTGKFKGKAWTDFTEAQLEKALALQNPAITDLHREAIRAEIERKKGGAS